MHRVQRSDNHIWKVARSRREVNTIEYKEAEEHWTQTEAQQQVATPGKESRTSDWLQKTNIDDQFKDITINFLNAGKKWKQCRTDI